MTVSMKALCPYNHIYLQSFQQVVKCFSLLWQLQHAHGASCDIMRHHATSRDITRHHTHSRALRRAPLVENFVNYMYK